MNFNNDVIQSLGMTLVHSLWQGIVVLIVVMAANLLAGKSSARLRYVFFLSGLMLLLAGFIATWCILYFRINPQSADINYSTLVYEQISLFENIPSRILDTEASCSWPYARLAGYICLILLLKRMFTSRTIPCSQFLLRPGPG
jgi:hypothetical protein